MRQIVWLLFLQTLLWKIHSSNGQRSIQRYLHLTGLPYSTGQQVQVPAITQNAATTKQVVTSNQVPVAKPVPTQPLPATGLTSLAALSLPSLIAGLSQKIPENPKSTQKPITINSNIDSKLLNNLAIALQLLIVSNILNSPPADAKEKLKEIIPESAQNLYQLPQNQLISTQNQITPTQNQITQIQNAPPQNQYAPTQNLFFPPQNELVPNANFVGGSSFPEGNLRPVLNPVRSTMTLMSPYEALGTLTSFSEPTSQFSSANPRNDFHSPYTMLDKERFSMNDLF